MSVKTIYLRLFLWFLKIIWDKNCFPKNTYNVMKNTLGFREFWDQLNVEDFKNTTIEHTV